MKKYVFTKNWPDRNNYGLKVYQEINIGFHVRENPSEVAISESGQIRELHETIKGTLMQI